jgi:hypothetical protein
MSCRLVVTDISHDLAASIFRIAHGIFSHDALGFINHPVKCVSIKWHWGLINKLYSFVTVDWLTNCTVLALGTG